MPLNLTLNQKQKEELSKFFFDVGKLSFAGVALSVSLVKDYGLWVVFFGGLLTLTNMLVGILLLKTPKTQKAEKNS